MIDLGFMGTCYAKQYFSREIELALLHLDPASRETVQRECIFYSHSRDAVGAYSTLPRPHVIYLSPNLLLSGKKERVRVVLHEVGHFICGHTNPGKGAELSANEFATFWMNRKRRLRFKIGVRSEQMELFK
jgi:hypothetical protein